MKSYLDVVMTAYDGILLDASRTWPRLAKACELDRTSLHKCVKHRGLGFLTLTLPELGKVFDRALDDSAFSFDQVPRGIPLKGGRPLLFGEILARVFDDSGKLLSEPCIDAIFFYRQLCFAAKKLKVDCSIDRLKGSVNEFFQIERELPKPYPDTWESDFPIWKPRLGHPLGIPSGSSGTLLSNDPIATSEFDWSALRQLCRRVVSQLGTPDWWQLRPKHGPGAVSESREFEVKYDFPTWPRKLERWFPFDWFGSGQLYPDHFPKDDEPPSRLLAVPKSAKGPRLICAEPIAHQWMQQGILRWLEDRMHSTVLGRGIRLRSQEFSRERALKASLDRSLCTIDLSSASDRLSCRLVEYIFQGSEILDGLHAVRTRYVRQEINEECDSHLILRKFSTQGSGVTFPIQSIVFMILSVFALRTVEGRARCWKDWERDFSRVTVFGDDIITPNIAYETTTQLLAECGLKVNIDKSYSKGFFRESCGMDAYKGHDVTPAYILQTYAGTPERTASFFSVVNNFHTRGLWYTAKKLESYIPKDILSRTPVLVVDNKNLLSPNIGWREYLGRSGCLALRSYVGTELNTLPMRMNSYLHRPEYKTYSILQKEKRKFGRDTARLSQFFFEDPVPGIPWEPGQPGRVKLSTRFTWVQL